MTGLSRRELDILIAARVAPDGTIALTPGMNRGNGGQSLMSLINKGLVAIVTLESGERRVLLLEAGRKRADHGPHSRSQRRVEEAISRTSSDRFGMTGYAPKDGGDETARPRGARAVILEMLQRKNGATAQEISARIGWKVSSVRSVLSCYFRNNYGDRLKAYRRDVDTLYFLDSGH